MRMEDNKFAFKISCDKPDGRGHLEHLSVDGRILLKLILQKPLRACGKDFFLFC